MSVFRLSAYLDGEVEPELLQAALHFTLPRFPFFATRVRRGLFWHYIEAVNRRFEVSPETELPCAPMDISGGGSQAFRVMYYKNRVSVEFFHILTDGTGGLRFLTALVTEYLRLRGDIRQTPVPQEAEPDGRGERKRLQTLCGRVRASAGGLRGKAGGAAPGKTGEAAPARILHFGLDAVELKKAARERQASVTALILAFMTEAAHAASDEMPRGYPHTGACEHAQVLPFKDAEELFHVLRGEHALAGGGPRRGHPAADIGAAEGKRLGGCDARHAGANCSDGARARGRAAAD